MKKPTAKQGLPPKAVKQVQKSVAKKVANLIKQGPAVPPRARQAASAAIPQARRNGTTPDQLASFNRGADMAQGREQERGPKREAAPRRQDTDFKRNKYNTVPNTYANKKPSRKKA